MRLNKEQRRILGALQRGCHLKVHRDVDGAKVYRLHCPTETPESGNAAEVVDAVAVDGLERRGYLQSNMKFPAATLLLTERGRQAVNTPAALRPLGPRGYSE